MKTQSVDAALPFQVIHLSINPSIYQSIYLSIHLSTNPSIYQSIYPSIYKQIANAEHYHRNMELGVMCRQLNQIWFNDV